MTDLNKKLESILYLISCIIEEDNNRNYGDRDVSIHKLKNHWEEFIEAHPDSDDPHLLALRNQIQILS